jgi:transcription elongation factor Elf1
MPTVKEREHTCGGCGSVYMIRTTTTGEREKGAVECEVCRRIVIRWNGTTRYEARLVKQGTPKRKGR